MPCDRFGDDQQSRFWVRQRATSLFSQLHTGSLDVRRPKANFHTMKFKADSIIEGSTPHKCSYPNKFIRDDFIPSPDGLGRDLRYQACVVSSPVLASTRPSSSKTNDCDTKTRLTRSRKYLDPSDIDQLHVLIDTLHIDDKKKKSSEVPTDSKLPKMPKKAVPCVAESKPKNEVTTRSTFSKPNTTSKIHDQSSAPTVAVHAHSEAAGLGRLEAKVFDAKTNSHVVVKRSARLNK
jgi:hypothetical protein